MMDAIKCNDVFKIGTKNCRKHIIPKNDSRNKMIIGCNDKIHSHFDYFLLEYTGKARAKNKLQLFDAHYNPPFSNASI